MKNLNQENLFAYYNLAVKTCVVTSKESFAKLIGANRTTVTLALNGNEKYATGKLVDRARLKLIELGLIEPIKGVPVPVSVNILKTEKEPSDIIENLLNRIKEKDLEIKRLHKMIDLLSKMTSIESRLSVLEAEKESQVNSDNKHTA